MGQQVPWLLASKASEFAQATTVNGLSEKLDDFGKVSGDFLTDTDVSSEYAKKDEIPSLDGYLTKTSADADYQPKGSYAASDHTHNVKDITNFPTNLVQKDDLESYPQRSEFTSTSGQWNSAYDFANSHGKTLIINGTHYDGTEEKTINISVEGGGMLPPAGDDGNYIFKIEQSTQTSGWEVMPETGKPIEGTENEITVDTTASTKTIIGLADAVTTKLNELDNPLTITEGTGIKVERKGDDLEISCTTEGFPKTGISDGLNVLSAKSGTYEWVKQTPTAVVTTDGVTLSGTGENNNPIGIDETFLPVIASRYRKSSDTDTGYIGKVTYTFHENYAEAKYNYIEVEDKTDSSNKFKMYTLGQPWRNMLSASQGLSAAAVPGEGLTTNGHWEVGIELPEGATAGTKYAYTTEGWASVTEGGDALSFDEATISGEGTENAPYGVNTENLDKRYLAVSGGNLAGTVQYLNLDAEGSYVGGRTKISVNRDGSNYYGDIFHGTQDITYVKNGTNTVPAYSGDHNLNMAAFGVGRFTPALASGVKVNKDTTSYEDMLTSVGMTYGTPVGVYQTGPNAWGDSDADYPPTDSNWVNWGRKLSFPMEIHSAGTYDTSVWEGDNTLHFILE